MTWIKQNQTAQLFGQLLVKQRLVSEEQLARAIERQRNTGQRLGDILAEWNLITQQHVHDVLRRQRRLRMAAAFIGALFAPLESYAVQAALPAATVAAAPALPLRAPGALRALDDEQLEAVSGQGLHDDLVQQVRQQLKGNGVEVIGDIAKLVNPVLGLLESDVTMRDVSWDPTHSATKLNPDGSITLSLTTTIGELSLSNIRIRGADPAGPSFGSITMKGIDLTGTTISLAFHH